jgi:DNA invertase Pin-like site-specific DNA recombinase
MFWVRLNLIRRLAIATGLSKKIEQALQIKSRGWTDLQIVLSVILLNLEGLIELVSLLEKRGAHFKSLTDQIDTGTPAGRFFFHVMASLAQMERELIVERTQAGLVAAKAQGRVGGRKRKMFVHKTSEQIGKLHVL